MRRLGRNGDDEHTPAESAPVAELSREEVKKKSGNSTLR